jgi:hypothetical protein
MHDRARCAAAIHDESAVRRPGRFLGRYRGVPPRQEGDDSRCEPQKPRQSELRSVAEDPTMARVFHIVSA